MTLVIDLSKVKPKDMDDALESACKMITERVPADNDETVTAEQLKDMMEEERAEFRRDE